MLSRLPLPSMRLQSLAAGAVLAIVATFAIAHAIALGGHKLSLSAGYGVAVDAPPADERSLTGYADDRRSLVLAFGEADTANWIIQTQTMIAEGDWRVRRVDHDNAPDGREVHWSAPFRWWLAALAWIDGAASGRSPGLSVERAVLYSGPVMFLGLLAGAGTLLWRRFSPLAAAVFAIGAIATRPFELDFTAGIADHHGLANICAMLTVLFFVTGSGSEPRSGDRRWFAASGVAGGLGLWISAATIVPVLAGLGAGLLAAGMFSRRTPVRPMWMTNPQLLRLWGRIGGGVSLAGWLVEYFPGEMSMRLEVNHPLYAVAWVGAAELLRAATIALRDGPRALAPRDRLAGGIGGVAAMLPLVVIAIFPAMFVVADPFLWRLHSLHIAEFQGLGRLLSGETLRGAISVCAPVLLLVPPFWTVLRKGTSPEARAAFVLALSPAVLAWMMGAGQVRWLGLAFAVSVPAFALAIRTDEGAARRAGASFFAWLIAAFAVFAPGLAGATWRAVNAREFTTDNLRALAVRDVAHWLRMRSGEERPVVGGSPSSTTMLSYYGGAKGVGTLYWENSEGLKNAAALFAAQSSNEAHEIATRLGLTHFVLFSWEPFEAPLARLHLGLEKDAPLPENTFATRIWNAPVPPPWLRAVPFSLPDNPALAGSQVRVLEVTAPQSPATAIARAANCFLELGTLDDAARAVPLLERFSDELPAAVMLAAVASRLGDPEGFTRALAKVDARIDRAEALALDEHVRLVSVLSVAQQQDIAQAQLRACMRKADERSVRRLTTGTLADLLALSDALAVPFQDPELRELAVRLLPPDLRK